MLSKGLREMGYVMSYPEALTSSGKEVLLPHLPQGSELQYRAEPFQFPVQYLMPL